MKRLILAFTLMCVMALPAAASSGVAWQAFVADVQARCLAASAGIIDDAKAMVDPTGSEHYGLAIVAGKAKGTDTAVSHICVYDKNTKAAELGSELSADSVKVELPGSTTP